jgi:hypothetical protein
MRRADISRAARLVIALTVLGTLLACVGRTTIEPLRARTLSLEAERSCRESAAALCSRASVCSQPLVDFFFGSTTDCETDTFAECARRYEGPGATTTPSSCAELASRIPCERIKDMVSLRTTVSPAGQLMLECPLARGSFAVAAECLGDGDCESGLCVHEPLRNSGCVFGACRPTKAGSACGHCASAIAENEPCLQDSCPAPLRCEAGRCIRPRPIGEPCGARCALGWCAPDGRCAPPAALDERCDNGPVCDLGTGLVCDSKDGRCHPLFIVGHGEPCDSLDVKVGQRLCAGLWAGRTTCTKGYCTPVTKPASELCSRPSDCKEGTCVNGHCTTTCFP